jgi:uncharacterized repeat protein (TIGR03803 family)
MTKLSTFFILLTALSALCPLAGRADLPALTVLHTFGTSGPGDLTPSHDANSDGSRPEAPLTQGPGGTLYGTTADGGTHGTGVIFKVNSDGTGFAVLHSFGPLTSLFGNETNSDGGRPNGALVFGKDGALYGAAGQGGHGGSGTIFKMNPDGNGFSILHSLEPKGELFHNAGGADPLGLTVGADGTLYGTAELGGDGRGLIFTLTPDGRKFGVIHAFEDPIYDGSVNINKGGSIPNAAVVVGPGGALYGTANIGGGAGYGVVYKMDAGGKHFAVLHQFRRKGGDYKNNGAFPSGSLTLGPDGFLYGCTRQGGAFDSGVAYKMSADGAVFMVLHTFSDYNLNSADGSFPCGPLAVGPDGRLYGLTSGGGGNGTGTVFKITTDGAEFFTLHDFSPAEGVNASTGLTLGQYGNLYGVSTGGGANGTGTIFRVTFSQSK